MAVGGRFNGRYLRLSRAPNLTATSDVHEEGSVFDPSFTERLHRAEFLRSLRWRMARPVMPDDKGIDYFPTQAVADFLATTNTPRIDGIIFPSVQVEEGYNVVLFHESARVTEEAISEGTEIKASTGHNSEDGWEVEYSVTEVIPPMEEPKADRKNDDLWEHFLHNGRLPDTTNDDYRQETLRVAMNSVEVHQVTWVKANTEPIPFTAIDTKSALRNFDLT